MQLRSDHKPLYASWRHVYGVMLELAREKRCLDGWVLASLSQHHEYRNCWAPRLVTLNKCLRVLWFTSTMRDPIDCELVSDVERDTWMLHVSNCVKLSHLSLRKISVSRARTRLSSFETMVNANLRCFKRAVVEHKAKVAAERKLATLCRVSGKFVILRLPSFLRDAEGRRVEDQSHGRGIVHEHFKKKFRCDDAECPRSIRELWRLLCARRFVKGIPLVC